MCNLKFSVPECTFNHSEITSATAQFFPTNCSEICGILVLNENTDLSHSQLKVLFSNITQLSGALRVENTSFTNLSFFTVNEEQGYVYHYCKACEFILLRAPGRVFVLSGALWGC